MFYNATMNLYSCATANRSSSRRRRSRARRGSAQGTSVEVANFTPVIEQHVSFEDQDVEMPTAIDEDTEMGSVDDDCPPPLHKRARIDPPPFPLVPAAASCVNDLEETIESEKKVVKYFFATNTYAMPEEGGQKRSFCDL